MEVQLMSSGNGENADASPDFHPPSVYVPKSKAKIQKKIKEESSLPSISPYQFCSRSAMLFSLVVAWSPILRVTSEVGLVPLNNSSNGCSLLAVGAKSGRISFWRIGEPQCYSIMQSWEPTAAMLIGHLQAHSTWITAISWAHVVSDALNPQLLFATGSSDGSVKIWQACIGELLKSSEDSHASFSLLKEVIDIDFVPVSVLSLHVPVKSLNKIVLAVGKGSGALEVWVCDMPINKFDKVVSQHEHEHIITGLAWAFDGSFLYSCSQDNSLCSWVLRGNSLREVVIPPNILGVKSSIDVPNVSESCFGLAVSPANLVLAVVRNFDPDRLNQMYQARTQKAVVEFFWIGGQKLETSPITDPDFGLEAFTSFADMELVHWGYNILWSLNQYDLLDKPLVLWDVVAALLAFKQSVPNYVERIVGKWLILNLKSEHGLSPTNILPHASTSIPNFTSRQLQLLNVIIRRVIFAEPKADKVNSEKQSLEGLCGVEEEQLALWIELLEISEKELRERLIGSIFSAAINLVSISPTDSCKPGCWLPVGLAQMEQWVAINDGHVNGDLKFLALEVKKLEKSRIHSMRKCVAEEQCSYCSASVPFEHAEAAFCQGVQCGNELSQKHKLVRCAVTMQVLPISPSWFCMCCQRRTSSFAPQRFFTLSGCLASTDSNAQTCALESLSKPLCPFCGILLQRLQPDFLLSVSPV